MERVFALLTLILFFTGYFWFFGVALRTNIWWGLACLFLPGLGHMAFIFRHGAKAKIPSFILVAAVITFFITGLSPRKESHGTRPAANVTAQAQTAQPPTKFIQELDQLEKENDPALKELSKKLTQISNADDFRAALDWLRKRVVDGKGEARYAYLYSYDLWQAGVKDSSAVMLLYAMLKIRIDAAYCADSTAPDNKITQWESQLEPIRNYFNGLSAAEKQDTLSLVLKLEEKHQDSGKNEWLCSGGMSFFKKYLEKHGSISGEKVSESGVVGGNAVMVRDDSIKPEFIEPTQWREKRASIVKQFRETYGLT